MWTKVRYNVSLWFNFARKNFIANKNLPNGVVVGGMEVTLIVVVSGTVVVVFEAVVVAGKTLWNIENASKLKVLHTCAHSYVIALFKCVDAK